MNQYPKRLIEVDLPIKRISAHARDEKNLRSGHPWHLHIWWARRPWGACRAVSLASLLPAPTDERCPQEFVDAASQILGEVGFKPVNGSRESVQDALLGFVGEMAKWGNGESQTLINAASDLIRRFHDTQPLVVDSFAGYGAIPGEALRIGCGSSASDLNPVVLSCLKVLLQAVPTHGNELIAEFKKGAAFIQNEAERRLGQYYSKRNGKYPIAYLWARTAVCEGPGCGKEIPLISQNVIRRGQNNVWIDVSGERDESEISVRIGSGTRIPSGLKKTAGGGHAFCPSCGYTTNKSGVKTQGKSKRMGQRLYGLATPVGVRQGKEYFDSTKEDLEKIALSESTWRALVEKNPEFDLTEEFVLTYGLHVPPHYGISSWGDLFSPRQKLSLYLIGEILIDYEANLRAKNLGDSLVNAVLTSLSLAISNSLHYMTTMSTWLKEGMISCFIVGNAIAMRWDWAEANPLSTDYVGGLSYAFNQAEGALKSALSVGKEPAMVYQSSATQLPLPDDSAELFFTDPPYYDSVPYADLSDLCYVWLKRYLGHVDAELFAPLLTPKADQIVVNPYTPADGRGAQSRESYTDRISRAFAEGRRVLKPNGIGVVVFAHKGTSAWESLLSSIIEAGFIVTAAWPIDTERGSRMRANNSAALASSVHIVIRPREDGFGNLIDDVGEYQDVLLELPIKIGTWMRRLSSEGIVGADAIFACLGPGLEIFSRHSRVEKIDGQVVTLSEYLTSVWAAVAKEALNMIFSGADATGFEEDARLSAMWLWTLFAGAAAVEGADTEDEAEDSANEEASAKAVKSAGFVLEYDAARKIAQGLGAHLEDLTSIIEVKGDKARLLPVSERARDLFGYVDSSATEKKPKTKAQKKLFEEMEELDYESTTGIGGAPEAAATTLGRVHQTMLLFGAGRTEAVRRFLVDDGVGNDERFWRLANALSALYPSGTNEKRWIDGVLARKKGLGF